MENKILDVKLPAIHLACATDELRPNGSLIEIKNNIATATEFHSLVKLDLTLCSPFTKDMLQIMDGKYIHKEVWKAMSKCDELEVDDQFIYVTKDNVKRFFEYSNPQGEFFNITDLVIKIKEAGEEPKRHMCYSPKIINMIGKVFGTEEMHFSFSKGMNGTIVFPSQDSGMFAVLMPRMTENTNRYLFY